jgi:hypothetical protein
MKVDVFMHGDSDTGQLEYLHRFLVSIDKKQDRILAALAKLTRLEIHMATDLTALQAAVAKDTEVDASAITLLGGLAQMLRDAAADPAKIAEIAAALDANAQALADAVVANTPAA